MAGAGAEAERQAHATRRAPTKRRLIHEQPLVGKPRRGQLHATKRLSEDQITPTDVRVLRASVARLAAVRPVTTDRARRVPARPRRRAELR